MIYPKEALPVLVQQHEDVQRRLRDAYLASVEFSMTKLSNEEAREFMGHGVARRLGVIAKAAQNIFSIFPPDRLKPLGRELLEDLNINLHAFVLHVNALQDNLAWTYVSEYGIEVKRRQAVSLFGEDLKSRLPRPVQKFLNQESIKKWHKEYSTDFRDALAHRIPLYVPPAQLTAAEGLRSKELNEEFWRRLQSHEFEAAERAQEEQNALGTACPQFAHSLRGASPMVLHPQVISDGLTALELYETVTTHWGPPVPKA
jgi:hypothetical protein